MMANPTSVLIMTTSESFGQVGFGIKQACLCSTGMGLSVEGNLWSLLGIRVFNLK